LEEGIELFSTEYLKQGEDDLPFMIEPMINKALAVLLKSIDQEEFDLIFVKMKGKTLWNSSGSIQRKINAYNTLFGLEEKIFPEVSISESFTVDQFRRSLRDFFSRAHLRVSWVQKNEREISHKDFGEIQLLDSIERLYLETRVKFEDDRVDDTEVKDRKLAARA